MTAQSFLWFKSPFSYGLIKTKQYTTIRRQFKYASNFRYSIWQFIKKNPTRWNKESKFYYSIFIWSSTCFGRHTAHHQEPKAALAASGFSCVEGCWTCSWWTLSHCAWHCVEWLLTEFQQPFHAYTITATHIWKQQIHFLFQHSDILLQKIIKTMRTSVRLIIDNPRQIITDTNRTHFKITHVERTILK